MQQNASKLIAILTSDSFRMAALRAVQSLDLPDCWIGAGFVRDVVWDILHDRQACMPTGDVDVIWFDRDRSDPALDIQLEQRLRKLNPAIHWSVKNQARMHLRNGDAPYDCTADAMRSWPETATAVAVRLADNGRMEINAPLGLDDLFALRLSPTANFMIRKRKIFDQRVAEKRWLVRFPLLQME